MKKSILISALALAAVATTSCSNEETKAIEPQSNAIEFGTYLGRDAQSRGTVFTTDAMETAGFGVFAAYTAQEAFSSQPMNFMYNQKVTKSGTDWTYSPLKYWPNNQGDQVSFFAYAPHNVEGAALDDSKAQITFTVNDAVASQKDLVVAEALKNQTKQKIAETVTFAFKHVLARIGLNVVAQVDQVNTDSNGDTDDDHNNGSLDANTTIKVTKVELIGKFDKSGVIDLTNSSWSDVAAAGSDVTYTWEAANFTTAANAVTTTNAVLNAENSYAMIIPQNMTGIKLKVYYTVTTTDTSEPKNNSVINNEITSDAFAFNFQQGKAYMFNLHLGMTSVKFSATVSDWDAATEHVVNVPINQN